MGAVIGIIASVFSGIVAWLVSFISRKVVTLGVTISAFLFITLAFIACIQYLTSTLLSLAAMPDWISKGFGLFVPFNFAFILSTILSSFSCRWAYDKAIDKIKLINNAS